MNPQDQENVMRLEVIMRVKTCFIRVRHVGFSIKELSENKIRVEISSTAIWKHSDETDQTTEYYRRTRQSDQKKHRTSESVDTIGKCLDRLY